MESKDLLVRRIQLRYEELLRPFPNADIRSLCANRDEHSLLHGRLDLYLGDVAGYSCRPNRLHLKSSAELTQAQSFLSRSFFVRYPQYEPFRARITREATPDLYHQLKLTEENRLDLLILLEYVRKEKREP